MVNVPGPLLAVAPGADGQRHGDFVIGVSGEWYDCRQGVELRSRERRLMNREVKTCKRDLQLIVLKQEHCRKTIGACESADETQQATQPHPFVLDSHAKNAP